MNYSALVRNGQPAMPSPLIPVARLGASDCLLGTAFRVCDEYVTPVPQRLVERAARRGVDSGRPVVWLVREPEDEDGAGSESKGAEAAEPVLEER